MQELVSIITPCYNSEKFISETIHSVLNQTYKNWEWIIVDDCSTDNSTKIIKSFNDTRITLIELENNSGAAIARNTALEKAKGRYITFIDSDDLWLDDFLTKSIHFLVEYNEELVYASYKRVDENLNPSLNDFIAEDNITLERILFNCPIPMLTAVYDSKRIGKIAIPFVDKREDLAMWILVLRKIKKARAIKETLGIYRIRDNSYSRNKFEIAYKQFSVYYNFLGLSLYKSLYYTFYWAKNGLKKYKKN